MSRKTSFSCLATGWSRVLCVVLALLIPAQSATALALRSAGPAHTHRTAADAPVTEEPSWWKPADPVFKHRSSASGRPSALPHGFEWAESLPRISSHALHDAEHMRSGHAHLHGHLTERHHHNQADSSVLLDRDDAAIDSSANPDSGTHGGAGVMAWAPPCANTQLGQADEQQPAMVGPAPWYDHLTVPLEEPPRAA
ncbi:MAG: hypothetical protein ACK5Y8_11400 [Betaproteobacteria bacterium]|nr:hypothetical protein [Rubrivivax sp.]